MNKHICRRRDIVRQLLTKWSYLHWLYAIKR